GWRGGEGGGGADWGGKAAGLADQPGPGPVPNYNAETGRRILAVLEHAPPSGFARWTGPLIAPKLGDVHVQQVWGFLRAQKIDLDGRKSWCESDDLEFAAKAADVVAQQIYEKLSIHCGNCGNEILVTNPRPISQQNSC